MGMADLKQLKVKRDDDFAENDPLAELTRIMGGMPETSGASDADDFGIDLERELMGELEQDLDPPARHPRQPEEPAADAQALPELGQAFEDELAAEFSASLETFGGDTGAPDNEGQQAQDEGARAPSYLDAGPAAAAAAPPPVDFGQADDAAAFVDLNFSRADPQPATDPVHDGGEGAGFSTAPRHETAEPVGMAAPADAWEPAERADQAAAADEPVFDPFAELAAMASPPAPEPVRGVETLPQAREEGQGPAIEARDRAVATPAAPDPFMQADFRDGAPETETSPFYADERASASVADDFQDDVLAHMDQGFEPAAPHPDEGDRPFVFDRATPVAPQPVQPEATQVAMPDDDVSAPIDDAPAAPDEQAGAQLVAGEEAWRQVQFERSEPDMAGWTEAQPVEAATPLGFDAPAQQAEAPPTAPIAAESAAIGAGAAAAALGGARAGFARAAEAPAIETVDVPEAGVEIADETGIPEFVQEEEPRLDLADELDMEFASAFDELNRDSSGASQPQGWPRATDAASLAAERRVSQEAAPEDFALGLDEADLALDDTFDFAAPEQGDDGAAWQPHGFDEAAGQEQAMAAGWPDEAYQQLHAPDDGELAAAFHGAAPHAEAADEAQPSGRRGLMIAALVAGVAVVGGISAFALSFGSGDPEAAPAMVKADPSPVKVRPETPGGVTVPNEDKIVYERVAGGDEPAAPTQEKLLSAAEEPVDLAVRDVTPGAPDAAGAAAGKSEDRVAPETSNLPGVAGEEPALVAPRRVRTMIVKPDGTLVPREEPLEVATAAEVEPAPAPLEPAAPAPEPVAATPAPEPVAADAPDARNGAADVGSAGTSDEVAAPAQAEADNAPVRVVETTTIRQSGTQKVPDRGPVAPTRPSDQPVEIVGNTAQANRQTEVAALDTRAPKPGEWSMQIASQPSPEGAQKSYANLSARYGSILNGRGVNIVKADIAGKGTFWRVRIPAGSRAEATRLCEQYKAAGGSCFVAK